MRSYADMRDTYNTAQPPRCSHVAISHVAISRVVSSADDVQPLGHAGHHAHLLLALERLPRRGRDHLHA